MTGDEKKVRSDKDQKRILERTRDPLKLSLELRFEDDIEGPIARAIESDVLSLKKQNPDKKISLKPTVVRWLAQHLGIIEEDGS